MESKQNLVLLLLDYEKAYDRVEWAYLEGTMKHMGFNQTWIQWVRALYIDAWCMTGINGQISEPFQLTRSIRQGCPLAPFLYLFIADSLGHLLETNGM